MPLPNNETDWQCVFVGSEVEAQGFVIEASKSGIHTIMVPDRATMNERTKRSRLWHVAVKADVAGSPAVWLLSIRGADIPPACHGSATLKHELNQEGNND